MKQSKVNYYNENGWNIYYEELSNKYQKKFQKISDELLNKGVTDWEEHEKQMVIYDGDQLINSQSDYSLLYCCESMNQNYQDILTYCLENNVKSIVDIGSAYSWVSDMFLHNNIDYYTITHSVDETSRNLNREKYYSGTFPNVKHVIPKDTLAIAVLSIGWPVYTYTEKQYIADFKGLKEQFDKAIVYIPSKTYKKIKHLFSETKHLHGSFYELIS